jgi:hypothetical protein
MQNHICYADCEEYHTGDPSKCVIPRVGEKVEDNSGDAISYHYLQNVEDSFAHKTFQKREVL